MTGGYAQVPELGRINPVTVWEQRLETGGHICKNKDQGHLAEIPKGLFTEEWAWHPESTRQKPDHVAKAYNAVTPKVKVGRGQVQRQPGPQNEFKANLGQISETLSQNKN